MSCCSAWGDYYKPDHGACLETGQAGGRKSRW